MDFQPHGWKSNQALGLVGLDVAVSGSAGGASRLNNREGTIEDDV